MSSELIRTLLAPPRVEESNQRTILFLNSRFRSLEDLDDLESIVQEARQRNDELESNLSISHSEIDSLVSETRACAEVHRHTAQELSLLRHSLTDELADLSHSLISVMSDGEKKPTLLEDIETLHRNLKELQSIKGYVQIVEHALKLSESSVHQIQTFGSLVSSVTEYQTLQQFVTRIAETYSAVEDGSGQQTLHLVVFLEEIRNRTWADIKGALSRTLSSTAEKIGWPMAVDYPSASPEDRKAFEGAFLNLLELQVIGEKIRPTDTAKRSVKDGLYPLQALVQPVSLRFKYHFEGSRQTNRLDRPEWYFTHVLNIAHEHRQFMESVVQNLLVSTEFHGINAWCEFTLLLFPLLSRKLRHTIPSLLAHPPSLAHTIYQALTFDAALSEEGFQIQETSAAQRDDSEEKWAGVSDVILGNSGWFEAWLLGEKKFAEDQYHEIISSADAWLIDNGDGEESRGRDLKPTNSARKVKALVEQVTDRYSLLPHFSQRTRFLLSVQLPLLDYYCNRITSSLDAFETLSSAFVRAVPGALNVSFGSREATGVNVDTKRLTSGVEGVQRLNKALLSAKYIEIAMESWGEELFFLELWSEIHEKPELRARIEANPLLPNPKSQDGTVPQDTIFEELIVHYRRIVNRAEGMIFNQVCAEIESELKAHFIATTSSSTSSAAETDDIALSQTLLAPIALLSSHLTLLRTTLPQTMVTTLYMRIASRLAEHIVHRQILYRGQVSLREGKAILAECELWVEACHVALGRGARHRAEAPWLKLLRTGRLIGTEGNMWTSLVNATLGMRSEEDWRNVVTRAVGPTEMTKEEVGKILKLREDCHF